MAGPSDDPVSQQLQTLLPGSGYSFYSTANQARTDDLLVRERASYFLTQASNLLTRLRSDYQRRFVPPLTRENPFPSTEALAQLREIEQVQQDLSNAETHIRGMSVPAEDRIWKRFRQEKRLLAQLLDFDLALVRSSEHIYEYVSRLNAENWQEQGSGSLRQLIQQLTQIAQDRERFLLIPM